MCLRKQYITMYKKQRIEKVSFYTDQRNELATYTHGKIRVKSDTFTIRVSHDMDEWMSISKHLRVYVTIDSDNILEGIVTELTTLSGPYNFKANCKIT